MNFSAREERFAATYPANEELYVWLRKEPKEEILEPELPICDPHHHLWDRRRNKGFPPRQKVYTLLEILEDMYDGHNVQSTVYVEAGSFYWAEGPEEFRPCGEVEFCQGVAAACDSWTYGRGKGAPATRVCAGIQGTCDLHHPNVEAVLDEMLRCRNFRGVRASGPYDEAFKRGLRALDKRGLVLDRWHHPSPSYDPEELPKLQALATEFPGVTFVLDHLGGAVGPAIGGAAMEARWRADIKALADACPNVVCKVGGIQMVINGWGLEKRATPIGSEELCQLVFPWYSHTISCFGAERCMFESNFPVDKDCVSYRTLWNAFKRVANRMGLSDKQKKNIFHDTALRVYKLQPIGPTLRSTL